MPPAAARIRRATPADARGIALVLAAVAEERRWIATEPPVDVDERAARTAAAIADGRRVAFVVECGAEIAGHLTLAIDGSSARIGMALTSAVRGHGIGGALVDAAIAYARDRAFYRLTLEVFEHNAVALRLYDSRSFVRTGAVRDLARQNGDIWRAVAMERCFPLAIPSGAPKRA